MSEEYGGPRRAEGPHTPQAVEARHSYAPSERGTTGEALPAQLKKLSEYITYCEELETEVAALKRDAEDARRYRWLVAHGGFFAQELRDKLRFENGKWDYDAAIDRAIDAAKEKA